jgi:hypothetical protein
VVHQVTGHHGDLSEHNTVVLTDLHTKINIDMSNNKTIIFKNFQNEPDKIKRDVRWWDLYAKVSPILYIIIGVVLWYFGSMDWQIIAGIGAGAFAMTAVTWWFWTVHTIGTIADRTAKAELNVQSVLSEIRDIKNLVKDIRGK